MLFRIDLKLCAASHRFQEKFVQSVPRVALFILPVTGSREYEKDGMKQRAWECRAYRIAKLDRIERAHENSGSEESIGGPPF